MISPVSTTDLPSAFASAQEGMRRGLAQVDESSAAIADGDLDPGNVVGLIQGQRTFEMNAKVLRTGAEMLGTLLDVMA
jgi:flagellar hook protein FlgE